METKFTEGKWKILPEECDRDYIRIRGTALGRRYKICNVLTPVYENVPSREAEETRANAKLIAAAPLMYKALEEILNGCPPAKAEEAFMFVDIAKSIAEQALKKATE